MFIFGVDPGTQVTGYGIIQWQNSHMTAVDYGCIRPPRTLAPADRNLIIFEDMGFLLDKYTPDVLAIETQYVHKNVKAALTLGMARGVVMIAARQRNIEVFEYTPTRVKKSVTGSGRASKPQIQSMTQRLLALPKLPEPEDAADALGVALCHGNTLRHPVLR